MKYDNWQHRSSQMKCKSCMWFVNKSDHSPIGRCRRHAPTMSGYPAVYESDWCGDHKIDESSVKRIEFSNLGKALDE